MERPTKKFKTSGGFEFEVKTYLSFGESRDIQKVYLDKVNVSVNAEGKAESQKLSAGLSMEAQTKAFELLVVSINGSKEKILETIDNLPINDGNELVAEIDKLQNPIDEKKKIN